MSVLKFEKKERAKEVAELDSQKQEIFSLVAQFGEQVSVKKQELLNVSAEKELAEQAVQKAKEERTTAQREKEVLLAGNQNLRMERIQDLKVSRTDFAWKIMIRSRNSYSCRKIMRNWNSGMKIYNTRIVNCRL